MRRVGLVVIAYCVCYAGSSTLAADNFRRLTAAEIRARIVGHTVTDEAHWSDHFRPDGTVGAMELGQSVPARWKLNGNQLCTTRRCKSRVQTDCFEIWMFRDTVEYRRDGITLTSGVLRAE